MYVCVYSLSSSPSYFSLPPPSSSFHQQGVVSSRVVSPSSGSEMQMAGLSATLSTNVHGSSIRQHRLSHASSATTEEEDRKKRLLERRLMAGQTSASDESVVVELLTMNQGQMLYAGPKGGSYDVHVVAACPTEVYRCPRHAFWEFIDRCVHVCLCVCLCVVIHSCVCTRAWHGIQRAQCEQRALRPENNPQDVSRFHRVSSFPVLPPRSTACNCPGCQHTCPQRPGEECSGEGAEHESGYSGICQDEKRDSRTWYAPNGPE
jgi:hypothetical protein